MEKMTRTAKWLDRLCLALILATAVSALLAAGFQLVSIVTGKADALVVAIDGVTWDGPTNSVRLAWVGVLATVVILGGFVAGLALLRNILKPMKAAAPFSGVVTKNLKRLGWLVLGYACLDTVYELWGKDLMLRFVTEAGGTGYTVAHRMNPILFVVAALLFLFSYIFHYGEELQRLSDETL